MDTRVLDLTRQNQRNRKEAAGNRRATLPAEAEPESCEMVEAAEPCGDGLTPFGMADASSDSGAAGQRLWSRPSGVVEDGMSNDPAALILAVAMENAELRAQLAEAQELLIETAVDAGELHARMEELQADLNEARAERDAWRAEAEQGRRTG